MTMFVAVAFVFTLANLLLLVVLVRRSASGPIERAVREELRQSRDDASNLARELREELGQGMKSSTDTLVNAVGALGTLQHGQLESFGTQLAALSESTQARLDGIRSVVESQLTEMRNANDIKFNDVRTTLEGALRASAEEAGKAAQALREEVTNRLTTFQESTEKRYDAMRQTVDEKLQATQDQTAKASRELREELTATLKGNADSVGQQLKTLGDMTQSRLDAVKGAVEAQLKEIQPSLPR